MIRTIVAGVDRGNGSSVIGFKFGIECEKTVDDEGGIVVFNKDTGKDLSADSISHGGMGPCSGSFGKYWRR